MTKRTGRIGSSFEDYLAEQREPRRDQRHRGKAGSGLAVGASHGREADEQERHGSSDADEPEPAGPDSGPG